MEKESSNTSSSSPQALPQNTPPIKEIQSKKSRLTVLLIALVLLFLSTTVYFAYQSFQIKKGQSTLEQNATSPTLSQAPTVPISPQPQKKKQTKESANLKEYIDKNDEYKFSYPDDWVVVDTIPEKFKYKKTYVDNNNLEEWLSGKMMMETCRGPILQNTADSNQLIAIEIVDSNGDGGFCWSTGYFMDEHKWKVSKGYIYPIGSNVHHEPDWRGDYFKMEMATENSKYIAFVALANYETFELKGESAFQTIISSFEFLKK
jgi:hypothetical protein